MSQQMDFVSIKIASVVLALKTCDGVSSVPYIAKMLSKHGYTSNDVYRVLWRLWSDGFVTFSGVDSVCKRVLARFQSFPKDQILPSTDDTVSFCLTGEGVLLADKIKEQKIKVVP